MSRITPTVFVALLAVLASGANTPRRSRTSRAPADDAEAGASARSDATQVAKAAKASTEGGARGASGGTGKPRAKRKGPKPSVAPMKNKKSVVSSHAPYAVGSCEVCHESSNPKKPGKLTAPVAELCTNCHDDTLGGEHKHRAAEEGCSNCHNPHDAPAPRLLNAAMPGLCVSCHEEEGKAATGAKVQHDAVTTGKGCANCHDPHSTDVEHLLTQLPFDLCVNCHSKDGMTDHDGGKMTNFQQWLKANPVWHAPVAGKDCSACHNPHGSENFRLLSHEYPTQFYAPYQRDAYALCFECHNEKAFSLEKTDKFTRFRDGDRNLHYLHVNKDDRGRTCRACHEVHAGKQEHHIRDAVPFGKKGWMLQLNYTKTKTGGSCEKTCHVKKTYVHGDPVKKKTK